MSAQSWKTAAGGVCLAAVLLLTGTAVRAEETSAVQVQMVVKVGDRDQAAQTLVARAAALEGYFTRRAREGVVLQVPAEGLKPLLAQAGALGPVIDRQWRREDLGGVLIELEAALKAKTEVQRQYLALLAQADTDAALAVEEELVRLTAEIETLKGQIRHLRHRIAFARVEVRFEHRERQAPAPDGRSSFAWLNTLNLSDLLEEF